MNQILYLKKNEERRIQAGHLWIYSNEIDTQRSPLKNFEPGQIVSVFSAKDKYLATAYINPQALISARILTRKQHEAIDQDFFLQRIKNALLAREKLFSQPFYRLVYAESDLLPGLIIDRYDQVFVIQTNTRGMEQLKEKIQASLMTLFQPACIVFKNDSPIRQLEGLPLEVNFWGELPAKQWVKENDLLFKISLLEGQKTGWFFDHRDNRARLAKYVDQKSVLDVFSYLGGWGLQAAKFGAQAVTCIDSSEQAVLAINENAAMNHLESKVSTIKEDAFSAMKALLHQKSQFQVIILDPPAFIKKRKDINEGIIAYLRLNELAMQLLADNGILVSCSCSLHLSQTELMDIIRRASIKTHKQTQILEIGFQGLDHPVHPAIPETAYLKAFFCLVRNA
jgi:23S rRNA (cytosine1962-C5)-methyltransferase